MVQKRLFFIVMLSLFIVTMVVFSRSLFSPFSIIDDNVYVTGNEQIRTGLSLGSIKWAFTTFYANNWHPVTWLSLIIDSQLFGMNPMGYHSVNVVLHAINTVLIFYFFNITTNTLWRSAFVAACFSVHPLHVESVAWIAERKDVLSASFWMLTLIFYAIYAKKSKRSMYVLSVISFALGLMAKPMLVTIPVVLLLLDIWPLERLKIPLSATNKLCNKDIDNKGNNPLKRLFLEKMPFFVLSAISSVITIYAQGDALQPLIELPVLTRIGNAICSITAYIAKMILPLKLAVYYPMDEVLFWESVLAIIIISGTSLIVLKTINSYPYFAVGWFWYLVTLLPVIGIIQVGSQSMADRYTYIPLIGLFTIASWGGAELCARLPRIRKTICLAGVGLLLFYSVSTWIQLGYWQDNERLLTHAIKVTNENFFAHNALGCLYEKQGKPDLALTQYMEVLKIYPNDPEVHFSLGSLLSNQGKLLEAITYFEEAARLRPNFAEAHFKMAVALGKLGKMNEAVSEYNEVLKIEPDNSRCHTNLGVLLAQQGRLDEAIQHFAITMQLNPNDEKAGINLQLAIEQKQRQSK
jgi:tetratricopeptide (TPR) repeat protein